MLIITVTRPLVSSMLSTSPSKLSNVPSLILTRSPLLEVDLQLRALLALFFLLGDDPVRLLGRIGLGLPAEPVKSPMPGVSRTRNQVSSLISMWTTR